MTLFSLLADILYVGHSLVGPNLPPMVQAALQAMDEPAEVRGQVINGSPLNYNWDNSAKAEGVDSRAVLAQGETDVLILAEAGPIATHLRWSDTVGNIARYAALAVDSNPQARVYLYEIWPSLRTGTDTPPPDDPSGSVPWRDRITAELILWEDTAVQASARTPIGLIPTGQAMGLLYDAIDAGQVPGLASISDVFTDDIHLNGKGMYLVAMVHAAAITGRNPEGLPAQLQRAWNSRADVVTDEQAAALQRIAWAAVTAEAARNPALLPMTDLSLQTADPGTAAVADPAAEPAVLPNPDAASQADPAAQPQPELQAEAAPQVFAPVTNPNLGLGLAAVNDWSVQQPFLDVMKTARPWVGHLPGQWGGWDDARLASGGFLDANGWPTAVPPELTGITTLILTDLAPDAGAVAGRYELTYSGNGTLVVEGRAQIVEGTPGRITFDFTPGDGAVLLTITETDPADPIRDITVVRQDRAAALAAGEIFNPDWLNRIRGVKLIRLMDWMGANNATLTRAADRPRTGDYTWARQGVPMEVQIALANALQADPWFSLPHTAEDALIAEWATLARDGLDPGLNAHVEYSNEMWNWQFSQAQWAEDQGRARWDRDQTWVQFYALRASQVMAIWTGIYGDQADTRLTRILGTQTGWIGLEDQILDAPLVIAEGLPAPAQNFDAYAITGYFSAMLGSEAKLPMVKDWIARSAAATEADITAKGLTGADADSYRARHRHDLAFALAGQELRDGSLSGDPNDSVTHALTNVLPYHAAVAADRGLRLMMYEGGSHVVGYGSAVDDPVLTDFFTALNYSPEMGALYAELLRGWADLTPEPFNAFVDVTRPIKWGSWGALRHLTDDNPRWQALATGCAPEC